MKLAKVLLIPALGMCLAAAAQMGEQPPMGPSGQVGVPGMGRRGGRMGGPRGGQQGQRGENLPNPDKQAKRLAKQLKLNDEQRSQVTSILDDQRSQMQRLMNDSSLSREDRMSRLQELHRASMDKINALLNDSQRAKFAQIQQKQQERRQERRRGY